MSATEPGQQLETGLHDVFLNGQWCAVDHVAQVVETERDVDRCVDRFARLGARITEEPYRWPEAVCGDLSVDSDLHKYMATIEIPGGLLVVASPLSSADQLSRHLDRWGPNVPHHVAFSVASIEDSLNSWSQRGYVPGRIADDGVLAQVFMMSPAAQIVELISRSNSGDSGTTFTCPNIAALSRTEEDLRIPGSG